MKTFPTYPPLPSLPGLSCRPLTVADTQAIMTLQAAMLAALPDPTWYYPSEAELFERCCERGESIGFISGATLAGFGTLTPWYIRPTTCYAKKIGAPAENTFDFQDVMVDPAYRRRGIHRALLALFERMTRDAGGLALYCTIAPDNVPSVASFQKAGYACVKVQPAYEGMLRGYFRKTLV
ncbi:MAG TPA: GNAT family N-acetyltransferase [Candidatus Limiplasma sp.]|nr:GNAT family N-acetyltransferase [Candidatus Limiplasma sp.]HPS81602.1 GNAT family N-acetyltransferase [Candidatus Limiplasma sp.]